MELDKEKKETVKYFIEYRFTKKQYFNQWDSPKAKVEDLFFSLHEKMNLEKISRRKRFVLHTTIIPPFQTNNIEEIITSLDNRFKVENPNPEEMYFSFNQATIFPHEGIKYLVLLVDASEKLFDLQRKIKNSTIYNRNTNTLAENAFFEWNPHVEIGDSTQIEDMNSAKNFANKYMKENNLINIKEPISRLTIIEKRNKQSKIYLEYDFIKKEWLNRYESLKNSTWKSSAKEIEKIYKKINNLSK